MEEEKKTSKTKNEKPVRYSTRLKKDGTPRKMDGYPPKEHDEKLIYELASILCTLPDMARIIGCSVDTLERRYMDIIEKGRSEGNCSLRRKQVQVAMEGNPSMLIWLGKNRLGQREPVNLPEEHSKYSEYEIVITPKAIPHVESETSSSQ